MYVLVAWWGLVTRHVCDTELTSLILEANVDSSENDVKSRPSIVGFSIGGACMHAWRIRACWIVPQLGPSFAGCYSRRNYVTRYNDHRGRLE